MDESSEYSLVERTKYNTYFGTHLDLNYNIFGMISQTYFDYYNQAYVISQIGRASCRERV